MKVGPKGRHAIIPKGWERVTEGVCRKGDMYAHTVSGKFCVVEEDDIGMPTDAFDCLIRKSF